MHANRILATALWLSLGLCAAASAAPAATAASAAAQTPDARNPQVSVSDGQVVVDAETLRFTKAQGAVTITWHLPAGSRYLFPVDGISFIDAGTEIVKCRRSVDATSFSCLNRNTKAGKYKYTIKVDDGRQPLPPKDPYVVNDW